MASITGAPGDHPVLEGTPTVDVIRDLPDHTKFARFDAAEPIFGHPVDETTAPHPDVDVIDRGPRDTRTNIIGTLGYCFDDTLRNDAQIVDRDADDGIAVASDEDFVDDAAGLDRVGSLFSSSRDVVDLPPDIVQPGLRGNDPPATIGDTVASGLAASRLRAGLADPSPGDALDWRAAGATIATTSPEPADATPPGGRPAPARRRRRADLDPLARSWPAGQSEGRRAPSGARPDRPSARRRAALRLPNFLVIGAARCGTTSLHYTLAQHPEVFVSPIKETNFFLFDEAGRLPSWVGEAERRRAPGTLDAYAALFADATDRHRAIGETSPSYLHPPVAPRIKARLPDVKLIAILRQPVEQAFSFFATWQGGNVVDGQPVERFLQALASPEPGPSGALPLAHHGLYHRHLAPFFEHFERRQIKVVLFDDLERDGTGLFADLFDFLGVDADFRLEEVQRYNATGTARSRALHRLLSESAGLKRLVRQVLPASALRRLST